MRTINQQRERRSIFKRKTLLLSSHYTPKGDRTKERAPQQSQARLLPEFTVLSQDTPCSVLVVNSSHEMAKEITLQLSLQVPGCSIIYAPTVEVAKWILCRRKIDLIVSSRVLPDGGISKLEETLEKLQHPADLIVVGACENNTNSSESFTRYHCSAIRKISSNNQQSNEIISAPATAPANNIKTLGADIRNDLNNPLQEIVAMVFVARCKGDAAPASVCALDAIERAAKNMAQVVNSLEDKIRAAL